MIRHLRHAFLLACLLALPLHAQDPQKPQAKPAAEAAKPEPGPGQEPDPKIIHDIMTCLAPGLAPDWRKAWFVIRQFARDSAGTQRDFTATFHYAITDDDKKGYPLKICDAEVIIAEVGKLNAYLPDDQQRWSAATFTFYRDGRYEATYDQSPFKPAPAKKAAKAPAKKKQETAK